MQISRTPHICVFTLAFDPFVGGAEIAVDEVTKRVHDQYQCTILTARFSWRLPRVETRRSVTIRRLGIGWRSVDKFFFPFVAWWAAVRLHWREPLTCTWAIMANRAGLAALFFRWTHRDIPYVLTLQEGDSEDYIQRRARWIGPLYGAMFRAATQITAISQYLGSWPARYRARAPVTIIPNGVAIDRFSAMLAQKTRAEIRQTMGVGEHDCVLMTASRLVDKNGIDILLEATARIPNTRTWILGDGPLMDQLHAYARTRGITDRVTFFGTQSQENVMRHLKATD
ncbi:glycosyltransferase family 4 protein, partial [Candidatus Uhrbacteria bacterium]|nr:glycosyltransferase family 4 protein [Candidatus Uhrbacteria bacterium]